MFLRKKTFHGPMDATTRAGPRQTCLGPPLLQQLSRLPPHAIETHLVVSLGLPPAPVSFSYS
jgi:hypothetical protein